MSGKGSVSVCRGHELANALYYAGVVIAGLFIANPLVGDGIRKGHRSPPANDNGG